MLAAALLAHYALSGPLWLDVAGRTFPKLPAFQMLALLPGWIHPVVAVLLLAATIAAGIFPQKKWCLGALGAVLLLSVAFDLNRLQPWLYFYLLVLFLLWPGQNPNELTSVRLRWLLAAVYAWGGVNKLTPYFAEDNFPWFCQAFEWTRLLGDIQGAGYAIAVLELLFAAGLLWRVSRPVFRWLVPGFHLFIVLALSPLGLNWNWVVIPWNVAMGALVFVLFHKKIEGGSSPNPWRLDWALMPLLLAWVMPVLNIWGCWDEALSWKMYSNTQPEVSWYCPPEQLPPELRVVWRRHAYDSGSKLLIDDWAMENIRVPAYNSRGARLKLAAYFCGKTNSNPQSGIIIFEVKRWNRDGEQLHEIPCAVLKFR